jgi:hypothetical protein
MGFLRPRAKRGHDKGILMNKKIIMMVPGEYDFSTYFERKIRNPKLEIFEVDTRRRGIQRKGNNHLLVFLNFEYKKKASELYTLELREDKTLYLSEHSRRELVHEKQEISVYSLVYEARMSLIAWEVLVEIVNDNRIIVDEGVGGLTRGPDLAVELKQLLDFKTD